MVGQRAANSLVVSLFLMFSFVSFGFLKVKALGVEGRAPNTKHSKVAPKRRGLLKTT